MTADVRSRFKTFATATASVLAAFHSSTDLSNRHDTRWRFFFLLYKARKDTESGEIIHEGILLRW